MLTPLPNMNNFDDHILRDAIGLGGTLAKWSFPNIEITDRGEKVEVQVSGHSILTSYIEIFTNEQQQLILSCRANRNFASVFLSKNMLEFIRILELSRNVNMKSFNRKIRNGVLIIEFEKIKRLK